MQESGFSLVEAMVSLLVIAGMAAMLFATVSANASAAQRLAAKRRAILLAQSLLAQATLPRGPGDLAGAGAAQGMTWRLTRRAVAQGARDSTAPVEEVRIDIADSATGRPLTSVQTLRLYR